MVVVLRVLVYLAFVCLFDLRLEDAFLDGDGDVDLFTCENYSINFIVQFIYIWA